MTSIKCGNCGETHVSVEDVKKCYNAPVPTGSRSFALNAPRQGGKDNFETRINEFRSNLAAIRRTAFGCSAKQADFIGRLYGERFGAAVVREVVFEVARVNTPTLLNSQQARVVIDFLLTLPKLSAESPMPAASPAPATNIWAEIRRVASSLPTVEGFTASYYAVNNNEGDLRFYKLDRPVEGKWAGRTFLAVQASDDFHSIREPHTMLAVLNKIAENPEEASAAYGKHIKRCGICHRTLTNDESRARGIGPVCAAKAGW